MAEKKGQHLVPACYLGSFIADIEELKKENPKVEAGIYVNSKKLDSGWRMKGVNHDIFKKSYYYNLPEDDSKKPFIENYLSSVESKNLKKVEAREIDNMLMSFLSYFMTLQLIRVDKFITENQKNWDQIANSCDMFCDGNYYEKLFKNIVKKQIPICDLGEIPYQNARIIYNNTTFPFISSDNPVIKREVNNADLSMVIPNSLITNDVKNSKESPFFH
ncbi:DUF4238 domain-containing protein [Acinetobacter sp. WCHAc060033]|uniref:DUF4238 domain-containing protein n=1 Tax=Acinetobacter sp. WCHAc060033 TaxID=2518624 RepID=UPI0013EE6D7B|nr:DUF4238 domain-containing protein [Acinetobacter sp. WCHAc060033]